MRFRYFDFTEIFAKSEKVVAPRICVALAAFFMFLYPLTASAQARRINGYAVQVAALSSRRSADTLVRGLAARGMNAYWVGGASFGAGGAAALYRVRIGNFQTIARANTYAENLIGAGLLESYAIAAYEPPVKVKALKDGAILNSNWKIQIFAQKRPQKYPGIQFGTELIDVVAAIGSRGWLLLSSESINLTLRNGNSALSRELVNLSAAIGSRGWSLNNNITKFLGASAPLNIVSLPRNIVSPPSGIIANTPPPSPAPSTPSTPPPSRASSSSLNTAAPEIGRGGLNPTSSTSMTVARSRFNNPAPRLQGSIEMIGGRMWMTLRNSDSERSFSGVARISLSEDLKQQDVMPIQITLPPEKEALFPVDEATLTNGAWILMVYDQNGTARLIRGASLVPPKALAPAPGAANSTGPADPNIAQEAPPSYVTGVYDTTNWTQPQVPPEVQNIETAPQASPQVQNVESQANVSGAQGDAGAGAAGSQNPAPQVENGPGPVVAELRQIAVTNDSATLELEISAQYPIKNVTVVLRAGDFQDVRQAYIPTSQGSVPFLVPVKYAMAGINFEVKDEAQRVLASGSGTISTTSK